MERNPCRSPSSSPIVRTKRGSRKGGSSSRASAAPDEACRAASGGEPLVLSAARVSRGVVLLERDEAGELESVELEAQIALARCRRCGTRPRVLPCDVLPRKHYGLAVIAEQAATYATWQQSLRAVVWSLLGERTPSHTTLHGWTEGLGAHALGLPAGEAGGAPFGRLVAEAQARAPEVRLVVETQISVDPRRYRSEARRERLAAMAKVMAVAEAVAERPSAPARLTECRRLALQWSRSCVLLFPSRLRCTAIEQPRRGDRRASRGRHRARRRRCPTPIRSPPGGSSKSPRS